MLFPDHGALEPGPDTIFFMAEDYGLCTVYKYHKHKIVLILSSMRSHGESISEKHHIHYSELTKDNLDIGFEDKLGNAVEKYGIREIVTYHIENRGMRKRIAEFCRDRNIGLTVKDSPGFLTTEAEFNNYMGSYDRLFMNDFYIWQRKRLGILLNEDGSPLNGKWSFDSENRKSLPAGARIPPVESPEKSNHTMEVSRTVERLFPDNPGDTETFFLPTTRKDSLEWMTGFFKNRFGSFGPYQDAISSEETFLYHSVLSPMMNIGLITPQETVDSAIEYGAGHSIPYQSIEGFVRQLIGWREFMRGIYNTGKARGNFFGNNRKLTRKWYDAETGIPPLDTAISRVNRNAYAHHIERLMVISNIMLLCEISPYDAYKWFMELFVDSSHWVMEPNVFGMGQFADGGLFATKPYISGSNYILKMSDYKKGEWCDIWDGLYWRFIDKHSEFFINNKRMSMMVGMFDKMDSDKINPKLRLAEKFIGEMTA